MGVRRQDVVGSLRHHCISYTLLLLQILDEIANLYSLPAHHGLDPFALQRLQFFECVGR